MGRDRTLRDEGPSRRGGPRGLGPMLFRLLDVENLAQPPARWLLDPLEAVAIRRGHAASAVADATTLQISLDDPYSSAHHARLGRSAFGAWDLRDEGSTNGTWLNGARLATGARALLRAGDWIEIGHTFFLFRDQAEGDRAGPLPAEPLTLRPEWERELARAEQLAATEHEILLQGDSGAGKEVLALHLHRLSARKGPLVSVNCAAVPETLLEDELFGHVRGAFSGAVADRAGLFRKAHEGTLFLDEVGDMPLSQQARLLRVLQDHQVRPIGTERQWTVDVRVIAATHHDIRALVAQGKFRADLLARLGLQPLVMPPLRERREDLGLVVRSILQPLGLGRVRLEVETMRLLLRYPWPLNVRELRQALLTAADLAGSAEDELVVIGPQHLPQAVRTLQPVVATAQETGPNWSARDGKLRERLIAELRRSEGNLSATARALGKGRTQVQRWIKRLGIDVGSMRGGAGVTRS